MIWKRLGMTTDGDSDGASKISEMLENKKYALFLDEVSPSSSLKNKLEEVGIYPNHEQGKVVFACRNKYTGHTDEDMKVQILSKEDSRMLFWAFAGSYPERSEDFKRVAEQIIDWRKCAYAHSRTSFIHLRIKKFRRALSKQLQTSGGTTSSSNRATPDLEILDVSGIYSLPSEVGQLTKLKCLRVSFSDGSIQNPVQEASNFCFFFNSNSSSSELMIPGNTISKLTNLEELSLDVSPNIARWNENADAIAMEVTELKNLSHLQFYFTNLESFNTFIRESQSWNENPSGHDFRTFRLFVCQHENISASEQAKSFELMGHTTAANLTDNLPADTLEELEACFVEEYNEMQSIVKEMVAQLLQQECLQVEDCELIANIIEAERTVGISTTFPFHKLKNFKLCKLERLTSICDHALLEWPTLDTIQIQACPLLTSLPSTVGTTPNLREIQCAGDWWDKQDWRDNAAEERFRTFHHLLI
ncbi:NB-ARC domain-containing protein [Corchorus olitorius]|uniref:NB-ARC domain-containing protein n=1 Tax=Corchorus olitorius TaxID=93759 RepID=A0A1R3KJY0_9ROSI|nr:NB-ARC domain-containing protein [Corchorus olitorius]